MPMPSSRQVFKMSLSMPRETSEYSICRSTIGCTAWARRMVSEPTSERPMCLIRPAVVAGPLPGRIAQRSEFDADLQIVAAAAGERLADQHFIVAHAVEVAGVEQRDAGVECRMNGGDALAAVGGSVKIGHAHAAEA